MIYVDEQLIEPNTFPDGTSSVRFLPKMFGSLGEKGYYNIRWLYDGDVECIRLWYLVKHLRSICPDAALFLELPYIPNARMDRVKSNDEIFTLKWFSELINSLGFQSVSVLDPHSNVATALINNVKLTGVTHYIYFAIQ